MFITKKHLSRRTFLRGAGVAVGLPFLDAMVPAWTVLAQTAAAPKPRMGFMYLPHGAIMEHWTPAAEGTNFELSPTLAGLQPFKDKTTVVTGLFMDLAEALGDGGGDHSRACGAYLSGVHVKKSDTVVQSGISMDQIAAKAWEKALQLDPAADGVRKKLDDARARLRRAQGDRSKASQ